MRAHRTFLSVLVALSGTLVWAVSPAQATTQIFGFTGGEQSFVVPGGVTQIHVLLLGGHGGDGGFAAGGAAAEVAADLTVSPGQNLYVEVGGSGQDGGEGGAGGFNGGAAGGGAVAGGGGGASDIRLLPLAMGLSTDSRLIIAAGGGGAGGDGETGPGGDGGDAGNAGETSEGGNAGGGAGTATEGGGGASGCSGSGTTGGLGSGGAGGAGFSSNGGGGGGGGLYGGGGGSGGCGAGGGGGGGGSSRVPAGGTLGLAAAGAAPTVAITYTLPTVTPPPAANPPQAPAPPNTVLGFHPPKKVKTTKAKAKVKFTFSSNVAGATFQCKIDKGAYAACASPKRFKAKVGKHKFSVRAVKDGVADPTPASFKFTVVKVS